MSKPDVGIHEGVSFAEYCSWEAINNSSLSAAMRSPKHYQHYLDRQEDDDSAALGFGRLCHAGRLEPELVLTEYAVMPDLTLGIEAKRPTATAEYKERVARWRAENAQLEIVTQQQYDDLRGVLQSLHEHQLARQWLSTDGPTELSMVWHDRLTGALCKGRIDKLSAPDLLVDLKTTRDALRFGKAIADYSYHRQAAFYLDGYRQLTGIDATFAIVAVESSAPYGCRCAPLHPVAVSVGRLDYEEAMVNAAANVIEGVCSDYRDPDFWELPRWANRLPGTLHGFTLTDTE